MFQVKLNPSLSVEMRPFVLNSLSIGSNAYRRQLPQKEQDIRTKRPARSGREKSDSSPGSPCWLRVSQLSERASFRCVRRTNLQRSGVRSGKTGSQRCFFCPIPPTRQKRRTHAQCPPPQSGALPRRKPSSETQLNKPNQDKEE